MDSLPARMLTVTLKNDLHALAVQRELHDRGHVECHIVESDALYGNQRLSWDLTEPTGAVLPARDGPVPVETVDLVWWRRSGQRQRLPDSIEDAASIEFINNECREALLGILLTGFRGTWVSHPTASSLAENKLVQLTAARQAGCRVAPTLVSQDPAAVEQFCRGRETVIKPVRGTPLLPTLTLLLTGEHLREAGSVAAAPAIYQALVPGSRHLRVLVFGERGVAAVIESADLDWRTNLDVPVSGIALPDPLMRTLVKVLALLGLRMGVFDLKECQADREYTWLEVNPQGQFLFAEGLSGVDFLNPFVDFLESETVTAHRQRGADHDVPRRRRPPAGVW